MSVPIFKCFFVTSIQLGFLAFLFYIFIKLQIKADRKHTPNLSNLLNHAKLERHCEYCYMYYSGAPLTGESLLNINLDLRNCRKVSIYQYKTSLCGTLWYLLSFIPTNVNIGTSALDRNKIILCDIARIPFVIPIVYLGHSLLGFRLRYTSDFQSDLKIK